MSAESVDLLVLGAGPAGIGAALAGREHGLNVVVVEESPAAGGQVYRAPPETFTRVPGTPLEPEQATGEALRAALARSGARLAYRTCVWSVTPDLRVDAVGPDGPHTWQPRALVVATGTSERVIPFPGWTCPGVIGLAASTLLLKSQHVLPGERTVVAGCGPLLAAVAAGIIKAGGKPAAVVDLASPTEWLAKLPALAFRPDLLQRGLAWVRAIRKACVPVLFRQRVVEVRGDEQTESVVVAPVDARGRHRSGESSREFSADALAIGYGLTPAIETTRLLGAEHVFRAERGGWVARHDREFRTTVERVYVAGDGAGISGAAAALWQGRLAGLAAARDLGKLDRARHERSAATLRRSLGRCERFGGAMSHLMALRPGLIEEIAPDTVVCRCEDVTRREIDAAINDGALEVNQLKAWTRCGMGPCQGRMCGETVASLLALHVGSREKAGLWTARPPLRPVPLSSVTGRYDYADIPLPEPAPP